MRTRRERTVAKRGRTDWKRVDATTDEEIRQWQLEEGIDEADEASQVWRAIIKPGVIPEADVRGLREYLDLTQEEFARRYCLPLEDVQAWEQHVRKPDGAARNFLWLITRNPKAVAEQLASPPLAAA